MKKLDELIEVFGKLPGIGKKSAIIYHMKMNIK